MRQTIKVEDIVTFANKMLSFTEKDVSLFPSMATREYKEAICDIVEKVLSVSGRYGGYLMIDDEPSTDRNNVSYWRRKYLIKYK